ncbi:O-antigen ligase family protein [Sporosarcina sp. UB5]|uniref:O-antigen ligase family protein n=1 Tax=Sporosarcina sp. UB5 TaxID=3047463 RepID=UPI003D79969B
MGTTLINILYMSTIAVLMAPLVLRLNKINRYVLSNAKIGIYFIFIIWLFTVVLITNKFDIYTLIRLIVFIIYFILYLVFLFNFSSSYSHITLAFKMILYSILAYLLIANLLNRGFVFTLYEIMYVRYDGLGNPNSHGIISAIGVMLSIPFITMAKSRKQFIIYLLVLSYTTINLIMTGSRSALLITLVFSLVYFNLISKIYKGLFLSKVFKLFFLISSGLLIYIALSRGIGLLAQSFKFTEFSIQGRLNPLITGLNIIRENSFVPYGLGRGALSDLGIGRDLVGTSKIGNPLDNSFILIAIETGILGLGLLLAFVAQIFNKFFQGFNALRRKALFVENDKAFNTNFYVTSFSIMISLLLHAFFEANLFSGIDIVTLLFLICCANIVVTNGLIYKFLKSIV